MNKKLVLVLIVFGMLLAGCEDVTPIPPPELVPGVDYIEGAAEVPPGHYLLVEFITEITLCQGGGLMIDFPDYEYENGTLSGLVVYPDEHDPALPIIGYFGRYEKPAPGQGSGAYSTLTAFQSLPFRHPRRPGAVLSVDGKGTVVADVNGKVVELEPGESWSYVEDACEESNETYEHTFINQGFLEESQIRLTNLDELRQPPED